ncbi:MAG: Stk1 family PASTA domain-containing Ser/Thr kinase [Eubacterium sp.]|nr:Stk1 family PASTA domain-containing Ser/Thr kinase [Eubacterium sp.]
MENYVGKRLDGRYEIHEIIGVGGMSVVYKAYDNVDDRIVAVKILKDEFANDDEFVRRFKNESKAIAVLSHPNIVKVYDVSFGDRIQYIVMEYVDGITLKEYIQKQGRITWNDAVFFISQVLKALQHAHDKGIVHRDVKPQNIMLLQTGDIKVTDFGIARFSRTQTETLTENAIGSVHYISPEQAQGKPTDERADIYSLGVVFYEMLAGRVPFESDSAVSVALMQVKNTATRLTDINADIPIGLEQICVHAMQKDPLERYQTATEMLLDLEEISMNPNATFDYSYVVDKQPTKYIRNDELQANNSADEEDDEDYAYDKKNKRKIIIATISGLVILIVAIVVLVLTLTKGVNKNTIKLQSFVGMSYDEVVANKDYDFNFVLEYEKTNEVESGTITAQNPAADERVMAGSTVTLTVAQPMEDIQVPNIVGLTQERAEQKLKQTGLTNIKIAKVDSDTEEVGNVMYTEPRIQSYVSKDTLITVYVSTGPTTTTIDNARMPNVIGLSKGDAESFLNKAGFKNVVFKTEDSEKPKNIVIAQSQNEGNYISEDTKITITVSNGVTTTLPPEDYTVTLNVQLPALMGDNGDYLSDMVVVYVDGVQHSSSQVRLDGTIASFFVDAKGDSKIDIDVLLSKLDERHSLQVNVDRDKDFTVDFSGVENPNGGNN